MNTEKRHSAPSSTHLSAATPMHFFPFQTVTHKMTGENYIVNLNRFQILIQAEFSAARQLLSTVNEANRVSLDSIIDALQYQDILNQRIQHLIDGFEFSKIFFHDRKFKHAFFDLQYFQLVTIGSDLEKGMSALRSLTANMSLSSRQPLGTAVLYLRDLLKASNRSSISCVARRILSGPRPFTSEQAVQCYRLYTMQSERIVLQWFLSNMPFGKGNDLLAVYEGQRNSHNESIDLF